MKIYNSQPAKILFSIGIDTSLVVSAILKYKDPNGDSGQFTDIEVEDEIYLYYQSLPGDFNINGNWVLWGYITTADGSYPSDPFILTVIEEGQVLITDKTFVKTYLGITSNNYDSQIDALIPVCEADYLSIRNAPWDKDSDGLIIYPEGSNVTVAEMINYKLQNRLNGGKQIASETIDSYSVSFVSGGIDSYPISIIGSITSYVNGE